MEWNLEGVPECLLCKGQAGKKVYEKTSRSLTLNFVECRDCSLVYQSPRLTRETSLQFFNSSRFWNDEASHDFDPDATIGYPDYQDWDASYRNTAALRLRRIEKFCPPPAKLLEIGTATGTFLRAAKRAGYEVDGIDVSETFAAELKSRLGVTVRTGFVEELELPKAHYDLVCVFGGIACWRDPVLALKKIRAALKPKGIFVLNYANRDSALPRFMGKRYFEYNPASFTVFSRRTLNHCLERAGFQSVFSENERQVASLGRIFSYLKIRPLERIAKRLRVASLQVPVVVPGTVFQICATKEENAPSL